MRLAPAAAALGLLLELGACGGASRPVTLVVYSPHGPDILRQFELAFEAAHPDTDVLTLNMPTGDILTRVRGEAANPGADLWWGAPASTFTRAADEGLLEPYRPSWADRADPRTFDAEHRFFGHFLIPQVILFNTERVAEAAAPGDWDELLDETWRGRVILRFPLPSGSMRAAFSWLIAWRGAAAGTPEDPGPGFEYLAALERNTKKYAANPTEFFEAIKRDPAGAVGIWNLTDVLFQRDEKGYPFGVKVPRSGCPMVVDCIALVKRGPQPPAPGTPQALRAERARQLYEFVTSLDAGRSLMATHARILTRDDVPESELPEWRRRYPFAALPVDPALPARFEDAWMERWDAEIKGRSG